MKSFHQIVKINIYISQKENVYQWYYSMFWCFQMAQLTKTLSIYQKIRAFTFNEFFESDSIFDLYIFIIDRLKERKHKDCYIYFPHTYMIDKTI